jgi:steroid delta-isomerase-like uncharacterized protein
MEYTILHRWFDEIWNRGNVDAADEMMAPDAVLFRLDEEGEDAPGAEALKTFVRRFRAAFPDINVQVLDVFVCGDQVAGRWTATGTHTGDSLGIPATGRAVKFDGMSMARLKDGKVLQGWNVYDTYKMMQQLGVVASPRGRR